MLAVFPRIAADMSSMVDVWDARTVVFAETAVDTWPMSYWFSATVAARPDRSPSSETMPVALALTAS